MGKKKKYIVSLGLAFHEKKDIERLRKYSNKGYHLKELKSCFYVLEKGEPTDYIYSIDYQNLEGEDLQDYLEIAKDTGWELVQKYDYILILRAPAGTSPIYTDKITLKSREKTSNKQISKSILCLTSIIAIISICRIFIIPIINSYILCTLTDIIIGSLIGFNIVFIIGYLRVKFKSK